MSGQVNSGRSGRSPAGALTRRRVLQAGAGEVALAALEPDAAAASVRSEPGLARAARRERSFDEGWRFYRGDATGAQAPPFDDSGWRELDVPHDWRIEDLPYATSDLAHVLAEVTDSSGRLVPDAVVKISFQVTGAGELAGVGSGNPHNADSFQRPRHYTWHGQALAVLRPGKSPGSLTLTAVAEGLRPATLTLAVQ